jgi:hypothetical protein
MSPGPLLMPYVQCPDCQHFGMDHPKRNEAGAECIGGYRGQDVDENQLVVPPQPCRCGRNRIGR